MSNRRSPVLRVSVDAVTPLAFVVAAYLLFAGHNRPGGGFAAGLVLGAVVALRTLAGRSAPRRPGRLVGLGVLLVGVVAVIPLVAGSPLLDQRVVEHTFPLLGKVKTGSALPFDIGVTCIVVGLVVALLEGLGGHEFAEDRSPPARPEPRTDGRPWR